MTNPTAPSSAPAPVEPSGAESSAPASAPPSNANPDPNMAKANAAMRRALAEKDRELEALKAAAMTEQEKAVAQAKAQGAEEFRAKYATALLHNAALTVLTSKGITAPELALGAMNLSDVEVDPVTGNVDTNAIAAKVDDVLSRYPMLNGGSGSTIRPATGGDQRQVNAADLASTKDDRAKLNDNLRWALGGGGQR